MNKFYLLLPGALLLAAYSLSNKAEQPPPLAKEATVVEIPQDLVSWSNTPDYKFNKLGKYIGKDKMSDTYTKKSLKSFDAFPELGAKVKDGLNNQLKLLKYRKKARTKSYGNLTISPKDTKSTVELLLRYAEQPEQLLNMLDAHQIKGNDKKGNVYHTGYFTPVLKVNKTKDDIFKYPIYNRPSNWEGKLPSRAEIEGEGVLDGKGLVLAYANDPVEVYFMQVQGSGIVEYPDGTHELFAYNGSNGHKYKSIGKFMIREGIAGEGDVSIKDIRTFIQEHPEMKDSILFSNPSYVFFNPVPTQEKIKGAGLVPLTPEHSIAVDPDYIPLGSCLLAAVPNYNRKGICTKHEFKLLLAQDVGGAINGPGHVDVYQGIGYEGRIKATSLHHYGALWLLLPKAEPTEPEVIRAAM
ncbi:MAG: membrane-bound lytic murein transglycosylase A [Polaribacter sp.]|jgi:membrane-bound lytic murein transglycosylase A